MLVTMNLNRIGGQITNDFDETEIHRNLHSTTNCAQKSSSFPKRCLSCWSFREKNNAGSFCLEGSRKYNSTDNFITNSDFWLVNILLRKLDISSKKEAKIKTTFWWKATENYQKIIGKHKIGFFTLNSPHWPVMQHTPNFRDTEKI